MFDPESKIIDFYPEDFKIDLNGKKYAWQGVALLPFVDEIRLKAACNPLREKLTAAEIARNVRGDDRMYVREGHKGNKKNYLGTQCLYRDLKILVSILILPTFPYFCLSDGKRNNMTLNDLSTP